MSTDINGKAPVKVRSTNLKKSFKYEPSPLETMNPRLIVMQSALNLGGGESNIEVDAIALLPEEKKIPLFLAAIQKADQQSVALIRELFTASNAKAWLVDEMESRKPTLPQGTNSLVSGGQKN
jgi:hypothetical protein